MKFELQSQSLSFLSLLVTIFIITITLSSSSNGKIIYANTTEELQSALKSALPGDTIQLLPEDYSGDFICDGSSNPTNQEAITVQGRSTPDFTRHTVIISSTTGFKISGGNWTIRSMSIHSGETGVTGQASKISLQSLMIKAPTKGVILEGDGHFANSLTIDGPSETCVSMKGNRNELRSTSCIRVGKQGVILQGDDNSIRSLSISGASVQGIYVNGSRNSLQSTNLEDIQTEGITVETGSFSTELKSIMVGTRSPKAISLNLRSSKTSVKFCTFNGIVEIMGQDNDFQATMMQGVNLAGCGNSFKTTMIQNLFKKDCGGKEHPNVFERTTSIGGYSNSPIR